MEIFFIINCNYVICKNIHFYNPSYINKERRHKFEKGKLYILFSTMLLILLTFGSINSLADEPIEEATTASGSETMEGTSGEDFAEITPYVDGTGTFGTITWTVSGDTLTLSGGKPPAFNPSVPFPWNGDTDIEVIIMTGTITGLNDNEILAPGYTPKDLFAGLSFLETIQGIDQLDLTNVTDLYALFYDSNSLETINGIENLNVSQIEDFSMMFAETSITDIDLSQWDISKATNTSAMFSDCASLTEINLNNWDSDFSNVINMSQMFSIWGSQLEKIVGIEALDTSSVTDMSSVFTDFAPISGRLDLTGWDVSKVTDTGSMFVGMICIEVNINDWQLSEAINMQSMFSFSNIEKIRMNNVSAPKSLTVDLLFGYSYNLKEVQMANFESPLITNFGYMFEECNSLESLDMTGFKLTSNATNIDYMFRGCGKLDFSATDFSTWDTSSVTNMREVFYRSSITDTDVSGLNTWNTSNVTIMRLMFARCSNLQELDLSTWDTSSATNMAGMFQICENLKKVNIQNFTIPSANSASMFSYSPICELTVGSSAYLPSPSRLDIDITNPLYSTVAYLGNLAGYSDEWHYVEGNQNFANGDAFANFYNANLSSSAGTYVRLGLQYTLELDGNNGKTPANQTSVSYPTRNKVHPLDGVTDISLDNLFLWKGYQIVDWNTVPTGGGTAYPAGGTAGNFATTSGQVIILYVQWEPAPFVVSYHFNGGQSTDYTTIVRYLSPVPEPTVPIQKGYIFDGWYTDPATTALWNFSADTMTPDDLDLYVKWISIADLIKVQEEDVVIYKNESTVLEIETRIDAKAEYTDYKGVFHSLPVVLELNSDWIS